MSMSGVDNANALGAGVGKIPDTASKTPQQLSISTKVTTFQDVQRSLEEVKAILEQLSAKQIPSSLSDESETEGAPGSIRIIKTDLDKNLFEIKTEDGWQKPMVGQTQVTFKPIVNNIKESTPKSIDELEAADTTTGDKVAEKTIFDEKADKFIAPRADYDSGWIDVDANGTTGSGGTLTHNLGVFPKLATAWFVPDADYNSGDPAQVFLLNLDVGMRHQDNWAGVSTLWTKTTMNYWLYTRAYITYGAYNVPMANGWDKFEEGYMRIFLWK